MNVNGSIQATGSVGQRGDRCPPCGRRKKSDPASVEIRVEQDADGVDHLRGVAQPAGRATAATGGSHNDNDHCDTTT